MGKVSPDLVLPLEMSEGTDLSNARCSVFNVGSEVLAPIYRDPGLTYMIENPTTADANGKFGLQYLVNGRYRFEFTSNRGEPLFVAEDVWVRTPEDLGYANAYPTVKSLLGDELMSYENETGKSWVAAGDNILVSGLSFVYEIAEATATDHHLTTAGGIKLYVVAADRGMNVKAFGATADGVTDDTAAIQAAINTAAETNLGVYFPSGHYIVTTLYDHYDPTNNPGFPQGAHTQGRVILYGEKACDLIKLLYDRPVSGTLIETTSPTGPALKLGGNFYAGTDTARRSGFNEIAFKGSCTNALVQLDGAAQHVTLNNFTIHNDGVGGKGLYIQNGFYASKVVNGHIASRNGDGLVCENASMVLFETVNVTNCSGTAWVLGKDRPDADAAVLGSGTTFLNCQGRNSGNGIELKGGRSITFAGWWLEKNKNDFDLKIHQGASGITFRDMLITSTELSIGSVLVGGNSGVDYHDACDGIVLESLTFNFCGPTANQAGIVKRGSCSSLAIRRCSFKNNGGRAVRIERQLGVTPTTMEHCDYQPIGATTAIGINSRVVDENGNSAPWLVNGCGLTGTLNPTAAVSVTGTANNGSGAVRLTVVNHGLSTGNYVRVKSVGGTTGANGDWEVTVIDSNTVDLNGSSYGTAYTSGGSIQRFALDMRTWTHLPEVLTTTTQYGDCLIALPQDVSPILGKMLTLRKNLSSYTARLVGTIDGLPEATRTLDEETMTVRALIAERYALL